MALACLHTNHPVGDGTFCRICGRSYIDVPDPFVHAEAAPAPWEPAPAVVLEPLLPMLPEHARSWSAPPAGHIPPALALVPETPIADLPVEMVDDIEVADEVDSHAFDDDGEQGVPSDVARPAGRLSQSQLLVVAGFGGGAFVMALLDRLVL